MAQEGEAVWHLLSVCLNPFLAENVADFLQEMLLIHFLYLSWAHWIQVSLRKPILMGLLTECLLKPLELPLLIHSILSHLSLISAFSKPMTHVCLMVVPHGFQSTSDIQNRSHH